MIKKVWRDRDFSNYLSNHLAIAPLKSFLMKLLFDENLSPKLPDILSSQFPGSLHVRDCGLKGFPNEAIWEYARDHDFIIVSKDSDFYQRSVLYCRCVQ